MAAVLTWKDEGDFGPAIVWNDERVRAWKAARGEDPDSFGIPFGVTPDGMEDLGWMTMAEARREARRRGLEFEEA